MPRVGTTCLVPRHGLQSVPGHPLQFRFEISRTQRSTIVDRCLASQVPASGCGSSTPGPVFWMCTSRTRSPVRARLIIQCFLRSVDLSVAVHLEHPRALGVLPAGAVADRSAARSAASGRPGFAMPSASCGRR